MLPSTPGQKEGGSRDLRLRYRPASPSTSFLLLLPDFQQEDQELSHREDNRTSQKSKVIHSSAGGSVESEEFTACHRSLAWDFLELGC